MLPEYGNQQTPTADPAAAGAAGAAEATAGQPTSSGEAKQRAETAEKQQRPFIKWCLINVVIDEQLINS
eukprot:4771113-Amphidinium_carterae.1